MPRCEHIKTDGERCGQSVPEGVRFCIWHDPKRKAEAGRIRKQGGKLGGSRRTAVIRTVQDEEAPGPPETAADAARFLSWITHAVVTGVLDARTGKEGAYACRAFLAALEKAEMEGQIRKLQELVKEMKRG